MIEIQEFPDLVGIPGRQYNVATSFLEFLNDWAEEWDVRGIVNVDPNSSFDTQLQSAIGFFYNGPLRSR